MSLPPNTSQDGFPFHNPDLPTKPSTAEGLFDTPASSGAGGNGESENPAAPPPWPSSFTPINFELDRLWQNMDEARDYCASASDFQPMSTKPSITSLSSSFASSAQFDDGLLVQAVPLEPGPPYPHSSRPHQLQQQHSSLLFEPYDMDMGHVAQLSGPLELQRPKLDVDTQMGLGPVANMSRPRSQSRTTPYSRYRSDSASIKSEQGNEVSALLSATSNPSHAPCMGLSNNMNKMSLHHRRTSSSSTSPLKHSPNRPMLTRAYRSSSFAVGTRARGSPELAPVAIVKLTGTAMEREDTVRRDLTEQAETMFRMPTTSQQDKARMLWIRRWLHLSYTHSPGSTVPRQGLYHSYTLSCREYGVRPINSASFGKAVRGAYPSIKTRRLGVRGNSKYHYVSIRPAIRIEAERLNDYGDSSGQWHVASEDGSMGFERAYHDVGTMEDLDTDLDEEDDTDDAMVRAMPSSQSMDLDGPGLGSNELRHRAPMMRRHTTSELSFNFKPLPLSRPAPAILGFPSLADVWTGGPNSDVVFSFWSAFSQHCEALVAVCRSGEIDRLEIMIRSFWSSASVTTCIEAPEVSSVITTAMAMTYDQIIQVLLAKGQGLPLSPPQETAFRALAEDLEAVLESCFQGFSRPFSEPKIEIGVRAAHLFVRVMDLQQLGAALVPILASADKLVAMSAAWAVLDRRAIGNQCALSCNCQPSALETIFNAVADWLDKASASSSTAASFSSGPVSVTPSVAVSGSATLPLRAFGEMLNRLIVDLQSGGGELGASPISLRAIITRTGFVTSQIMRHFTLRSDPCFGLFQLVKTWADDWVVIQVLRQLALTADTVGGAQPPSEMSVAVLPMAEGGAQEQELATAVPTFKADSHF